MRPLEFLSSADVSRIIAEAHEVLSRLGVRFQDAGALSLLGDHGARIDRAQRRAFLGPDLLQRALATAPPVVRLFDLTGQQTHEIGGGRQYFTPGSSATAILDCASGNARAPTTADYVQYVKVVSTLPHIAAQSTAFIPADVPVSVSDSYRLYLSLMHGKKPVVTGTFSAASFAVMKDLQLAVRGGPRALEAQPLALFSCCPTSPLAWGEDASRTLLDCARSGIPVELVPMALAGFIAPVTLAGTLVQHAAEALAGVVASQVARPGAPVLFGCASTVFDIRSETTPMGAVESMLLACGAAQIGRRLGLPTQAYIVLSDSKALDTQAGIETGMGGALAALSGINQVSGPGMLDLGNCFSLEKLVVDHEVCAMAARLRAGISQPASRQAEIIEELLREGHLLIAPDTRSYLRQEVSFPGAVIDRTSRQRWTAEGRQTLHERVERVIAALLARYEAPPMPMEVTRALVDRMSFEARAHGLSRLPSTACEL